MARNVGGGRPGVEDRAAHGQPGKVGAAFAERLEDSPFDGLAQDRGVPADETGITLVAAEAPRLLLDQLAREPEGLCASVATALESVAHPKQRLAWDGPGRARPRARAHLPRRRAGTARACATASSRLTTSPRRATRARRRRLAEGVEERFVSDPDMPGAEVRRARPHPARLRRRRRRPVLMVYGSWAVRRDRLRAECPAEPWR